MKKLILFLATLSLFFGAAAIMSFTPSDGPSVMQFEYESASEKLTDDLGEFYIVRSDAFGGSDVVIQDGKIWAVAQRRSGIAVELEQTDAYGNAVVLPVEYAQDENGGKYYLSDYTRNIVVYNSARKVQGRDVPVLYESASGTFDDPIAITVYKNLLQAYDFYADPDNTGVIWKGINGQNDDISSNAEERGEIMLRVYVHYGVNYQNAECGYDSNSGYAIMNVGDGMAQGIKDLGKAADIIGHEYQHAISDFAVSGGYGLMYLNETGAISEAVSDVFGALIEGYDPSDDRFWTIGEDATSPDGIGVRSMKDCSSEDAAYHMSDKYPLCTRTYHDHRDCDNGSVHSNCTILTHSLYRMYQRMPDFFTRENIGKLWFGTLCRLSYRSDFAQFARAMNETAREIFPADVQQVVYDCLFERGLISGKSVHTVTFMNGDKLVEKVTVEHNGSVVPPVMPDVKTENGVYKFAGWGAVLDNIISNKVLQPRYVFDDSCTVTFYNGDEVFYTAEVPYGSNAVCDITPARASDRQYDYVFSGWEGDLNAVTEDRSVYAKFDFVLRSYTVSFLDGDNVLYTAEVPYGSNAVCDITPARASDRQYDYVFSGWEGDLNAVTEDRSVYAKFDSVLRSYTVSFLDGDDEIERTTYKYGEKPIPPDLTRFGYTPTWTMNGETIDIDNISVDGDMQLTVVWKLNSLVYVLPIAGALVLGGLCVGIIVSLRKKGGKWARK